MRERFIHVVTQYQLATLLLALLIFALAAAGLSRYRIDPDYRVYFDPTNPDLQAFEHIEAVFTRNDTALFVVAPADGDVFTADTLHHLLWLADESWQLPYSIRVDALTNFQHTTADGDTLTTTDLIPNDWFADGARPNAASLAAARSTALNEPRVVSGLVSKDGSVAAVNVTLALPGKDKPAEIAKVATAVRDLRDRLLKRTPKATVHLHGVVMGNNAFSESTQRNMGKLLPITLIAVMVLIGLLLRSVWVSLATFAVVVVSALGGIGLSSWFGIAFNSLTSMTPIILITVAVAHCVHIALNYRQRLAVAAATSASSCPDRDTRAEAMVASFRINFQPVFLASFTTIIGMLSLNFADSPPFRDMGNIVALGMGLTWFFSITMLPAMLCLLPTRVRGKTDRRANGSSAERLGHWVEQRRRPVLIGGLLIAVVSVVLASRNELDDVWIDYFSEQTEYRQSSEFIDQRLGGILTLHLALDAGEAWGIGNPAYLRDVEKLTDWLRQRPQVAFLSSFSDTMKHLNRTLHGGKADAYRLPDDPELAKQYLLLYELSLPFGQDLTSQIDLDKASTRMVYTTHAMSSREQTEFAKRVEDWSAANLDLARPVKAVGSPLMFSRISQRNIGAMIWGTLLIVVVIAVTLAIALRSPFLGALSLIPNLLPIAAAFGLWKLSGQEVSLSLTVVGAMALGIVIDDTVHVLSKYLHARRQLQLAAILAVRHALQTVAGALTITSIALIGGFMLMTMADYLPVIQLGLMLSLIVGLALIADLLFLPALLMLVGRWQDRRQVN